MKSKKEKTTITEVVSAILTKLIGKKLGKCSYQLQDEAIKKAASNLKK